MALLSMGYIDVSGLVGSTIVAKKLLFVVNDPDFFLSHRLPLAEAGRKAGLNVHVATKRGESSIKIEQLGFPHHELPLSRSGKNPFNELVTFIAIWRLFRSLRPDLVHLVTIKPVLYGGIAAYITKIPGVVSAISGLGFLFVKRSNLKLRLLRYMVLYIYRLAMRNPNQVVIFQNPTDMEALITAGGVRKENTTLISGSGVDLQNYPMLPEKCSTPVVIMASRLLKDKGVYEFVEAARILHSQGIKARFQLVGAPDLGNPESVNAQSVQTWQKEGVVEYLGYRHDIQKLFSLAHIVTLPSYREGLPKVLIEAAACGRAVVTTDTPGCRDAIKQDITGLLVPIRDAIALAEAIKCLIKDNVLRQEMGRAGRDLAKSEFDIDKVIAAHLTIYQELLAKSTVKIAS